MTPSLFKHRQFWTKETEEQKLKLIIFDANKADEKHHET